ncbi:MAG TPA: benzoate 1,2-dioxygenase electron transfer component BenC [Nocardioidaceae bacterium]|nr:benzoate 1,2-dioxygenase electron transfer component BenC [Nocardioidaceae bacterium]
MTSYQVALAFEDGITRFITCDDDETVADASYRARINIPLDCRDGACGTCKALCESGRYDGGEYIDEALTEDEAAQGYALPCQMVPESDLVLQIPTTSEVAKTAAGTHRGTVTAIDRHSDSTVGFSVALENRAGLAFLPGQYVNVAVPGTGVTRSYSFANAPSENEVSFLVRVNEQGAMSEYLRDRAQVGDSLEMTGPMGSFFLREPQRPALYLAGGTGLAPLLSMLRKQREDGFAYPVHLVYGVSRDDDLVHLETLEQLSSEVAEFTYEHCVSDPASTAPSKGYVTGLVRPEHVHDGNVDVYLCGPPAMVESVRGHLEAEGITPAGFYYEKFALTGTPENETIEDVPAEVAEPVAADPTSTEGYEIGEEHPAVAESDAQFDARMALELGVVELTVGRLTPEQLAEYRILAEASSPSIDSDHLLDAAAFTDTNAAFHDHLFRCTGNEVLLEAYHRLEVTRLMTQVLRDGAWVDQQVPADHAELVEAFERGDREAARRIVIEHSERAKTTMRAALAALPAGAVR